MKQVWGKVAGLQVGYDFDLGHATIEVPLYKDVEQKTDPVTLSGLGKLARVSRACWQLLIAGSHREGSGT